MRFVWKLRLVSFVAKFVSYCAISEHPENSYLYPHTTRSQKGKREGSRGAGREGESGEIQTEEEDKEKKGGERRTSAVGKRNIRTGRGNHGIVMLEEILERIGSNIDNAMLR